MAKKFRGLYQEAHGSRRIAPIKLYCLVSIFSLFVLCACFFLSHGSLISHYFFHDTRDTGMDFFHSIEYVRGRKPYERFYTLYPPLANLFFYFLYIMVPREVSQNWAPTFEAGVWARGTDIDLRTQQAPMLLFILFVAIASWMLITMIRTVLKRYSFGWANCAALCFLLCPGSLYAIERGNILFATIPLILFFLEYRDSENKILRELALLSLAVAAGLKLYPAFFGVLLLRDKKYGQAVRAVLYGILSVILPALVFQEGLMGIPMWLSVVFHFGSANTIPWIGTGFANILHRVALYAKAYFGIEIGTGWFSIAAIILSMILLLVSTALKKEWQSTLAITMAIILFQSQGQYIFSFLVIPMALFFAEEERFNRHNVFPFLLLTAMTVHLPLFYTRGQSYPGILFAQICSILLMIWCVVTGICEARKQ